VHVEGDPGADRVQPGAGSAEILAHALQALARVAHRGAAATDNSGDGAGLLTQIPSQLFYRDAASRGLPLEADQPFAVGVFFLPMEHAALGRAIAIIDAVLREGGLPILGWRDVPIDAAVLGEIEVAVGAGLLIVNVLTAEVPPPGVGVNTVTDAVPVVAISAAVI